MGKEALEKFNAYAKEHWPEAVAATLVAGGAAAWLLIHYLKHKKRVPEERKQQLEGLQGEASIGKDEAGVLLETGAQVVSSVPGAANVAAAMAGGIPSAEGKEAMKTLSKTKNGPKEKPTTKVR